MFVSVLTFVVGLWTTNAKIPNKYFNICWDFQKLDDKMKPVPPNIVLIMIQQNKAIFIK